MRSDRARFALASGLLALGLLAPRAASAACVLTCPADVRVSVANDGAGATVNYTVIGNADCQEIIQTAGLPSGALFPVGTTGNFFEDGGSEANCHFDVVVAGRPGAPALGALGLSALAALLAGLGIWAARRRARTAA